MTRYAGDVAIHSARVGRMSRDPLSSVLRPRLQLGRALRLVVLAALAAVLPACSHYSFTGASVPAHLETVAVPLAEVSVATPLTTLDEELTELLVDRFVRQTRLSLETSEAEADAVLTARIVEYRNDPAAVGGDERAALNRVTIRVEVTYFDQAEDRELMGRGFSAFETYDPVASGPDGEAQAAQAVLADIADKIFAEATSDW